MRAELTAACDLSSQDMARWRELASRALEPNPFFEPEYVLPLARGLGQETEVRLLTVRDGGSWSACMPLQVAPRWRRIPLRAASTWRGHVLYGLLGTPLVDPDRPEEALAALLAGLPAAGPVGFTALEWVADDGPLAPALTGVVGAQRPAAVRFERFERATLKRRENATYLEETLSSKHRRELRRQRRKLGEALGEDLEMVDRAGEGAACARLISLEAAAAKAESGTVLAGTPGHAAFFEEMCRSFAELGRLQMLELQGGGQTVAIKCNLVAGDTIFFLKIAYDSRWSSYSPGILLELEMIDFFHEKSDAKLMDSCADANNAMINRLWPDRRPLSTYLLPAGGVRGRAVKPALAGARSLRNLKRRNR